MLGIATGARLNDNAQLAHDLDLIRATSTPAVRWYPNWPQIEPVMGSGNYDFTHTDTIMNGLEKLGIESLLGVSSRGDGHIFDPDHVAAIGPYAAALAARYDPSGMVLGYEGVNEGSLQKADTNPTPARYTTCQMSIYTHIKALKPNALVGTGGIIGAADFLTGLYASGCKDYFDMVCWHPYCRPLSPTAAIAAGHGGWPAMLDARKVMVANADAHKQIWVTEFGTNTGGPEACTEVQQASDLKDAVTRFRKHAWAGPFFMFTGWDPNPPNPKDKGDWMGLYRSDGSGKPALAVFESLTAAA